MLAGVVAQCRSFSALIYLNLDLHEHYVKPLTAVAMTALTEAAPSLSHLRHILITKAGQPHGNAESSRAFIAFINA